MSHPSTANARVQAKIIFCLDYCNNLLTGFFTFPLAPFSIFSHVSKSDFVKTCQIMLPLHSEFSLYERYSKILTALMAQMDVSINLIRLDQYLLK